MFLGSIHTPLKGIGQQFALTLKNEGESSQAE